MAATYLFGFLARNDPDTMTLERALSEPDAENFLKAMEEEIAAHMERKHWKIVPIKCVPRHNKPIPMVWSMKRKRDPVGDIIKWKARLCAGGHRQIHGVNYWETYSPVVSWSTVRMILILALVLRWHMRSIDFVLAYPQADVKTDIYMHLPAKGKIPGATPGKHVLKLRKNLYGLKDAGRTWNEHIVKGLIARDFIQSKVDPCLFIKGKVILVLYVDDAAIFSPDKSAIDSVIASLKEDFVLTDEGELKDYIGVHIEHLSDGQILLSQPRMIDRCLQMLNIPLDSDSVKTHDTPADSTKVLHRDSEGPPRKKTFHYRSIIGALLYLTSMSRPELSFAVHQCARFSQDPKLSHEQAVTRICRYLKATRNQGMILNPDLSKGFECWVDADWAGNWVKEFSHDPSTAYSRTGYMITYAGCPIVWASKIQSLIALSTCESEYIALSTALRDVLSLMNLLKELKQHGIPIPFTHPHVKCKVFEDNAGAIQVATNPKLRPRTKYLSVKLHHFVHHVRNKDITIQHISSKEQLADIFTKPLPRDQFRYLRKKILHW